MAQKRGGSLGESLRSTFAAIVIPLELVIAVLIYLYVLGNPATPETGVAGYGVAAVTPDVTP